MKAPIYTYFSPVPELNMLDEFRLLLLWRENWSKAGFEPVVLNEYIARQHPFFKEFDEAVSKFPTVNPVHYEKSCFMRHLSMAQIGGGILSDFDVMPNGVTPELPQFAEPHLTVYQVGGNGALIPCLTSGGAEAYLGLCKQFAKYVPQADDKEGTRVHISDQSVINKLAAGTEYGIAAHPIVVGYGEDGWEKAAAIHFANANCTPKGKTPKYLHVPLLMR